MPKPLTTRTTVKYGAARDATHPEPTIVENPPAPTAAQALADGKRQVDATR